MKLSTNILATGYCLFKQNPFSLYGENVFIGFQMIIIIALFIIFGKKESRIIYLFTLILMVILVWQASDPTHIPEFIIEHSILAQTILSKNIYNI